MRSTTDEERAAGSALANCLAYCGGFLFLHSFIPIHSGVLPVCLVLLFTWILPRLLSPSTLQGFLSPAMTLWLYVLYLQSLNPTNFLPALPWISVAFLEVQMRGFNRFLRILWNLFKHAGVFLYFWKTDCGPESLTQGLVLETLIWLYFRTNRAPACEKNQNQKTENALFAALDLIPVPVIWTKAGISRYNLAALVLFSAHSQAEASNFASQTCLSSGQTITSAIPQVSRTEKTDQTVLGTTKLDSQLWEWKASTGSIDSEMVLVLIATNITDLEHFRAKSQQESLAKSALIRSFSHEVNTPLNAIMYLCNELKIDADRPPAYYSKLRMLSTNCSLLYYVLSDIIDYAQALAGRFDIVKTDFKLRPCLKHIVSLFTYQIEKKRLKLKVAIDPLVPEWCYSDERKLGQIFMNLLSNAVKYTLKGHIEVSVSLLDNGKMRMLVSDSGIGIPDSNLDGIFDMRLFDDAKGAGVGLYVSNVLAQRLGSPRIYVQSEENIGSTFWVDLDINSKPVEIVGYSPTSYADFSDPPAISSPLIARSRSMNLRNIDVCMCPNVLVVDDNEFNRTILRMMLEKIGLTCEEAITGLQAVLAVSRRKKQMYQLVIMDLEMPEMGGIEATKTIMSRHLSGEIRNMPPIIALTAYPSSQVKAQCIDSGMKDFLSKPLAMEKLQEVVSEYCSVEGQQPWSAN